jgi:serine/threonine protein kinase
LSSYDIQQLFSDVAKALQYVRHCGFVHNDVKDSNVLVMKKGDKICPKLIDFGCAVRVKSDADLAYEYKGTPLYSSPEANMFLAGLRATGYLAVKQDVW